MNNFIVFLGPPWEDNSYLIIAIKRIDETGITLYREFCRIKNRGRYSVMRANSLVDYLNNTSYGIPWDEEDDSNSSL